MKFLIVLPALAGSLIWLHIVVSQDENDTILPDTPLVVQLDNTGAVDLIYEAADAESLTIIARSLDGSVDTTLEVYDQDGNLLASNDDAETSGDNLASTDSLIENLPLFQAGVYTIRLSSFTGVEVGEVEVSISVSETLPTTALGKRLFVTEPLKVYLTGQEAVDLIYPAATSETISIYADSLDSNITDLDSTLEILDTNGEQLAYSDDLSPDSGNPGIENLQLPNPGVYTVRLDTFDASGEGGVEVRVVTDAAGSRPTLSDEQGINFGDTLTITLAQDEIAVLTFEADSDQEITIKVEAIDPTSPEQDLTLQLYDPEGNFLIEDDDSGSNLGLGDRDPAIENYSLEFDGTYRIEIASLFNIPGSFSITLESG